MRAESVKLSWSGRDVPSRPIVDQVGLTDWNSQPWVALVGQIEKLDRCHTSVFTQGRLNQWAHWARAQGPRIFFSFWEAPNRLWWNKFFLNNYLIVAINETV